jgi:hypothetical protein
VGEIGDGPPQIVLCVGDDVAAAVKASVLSFSTPEEAATTITGGTIDTLWLAAYLGSDGSTPPAYRIETIEVNGRTIRVAYERDESPARSADLLAYLVWVPVGRLEAGVYTLELFDVVAGNVTASRPWHVFVE